MRKAGVKHRQHGVCLFESSTNVHLLQLTISGSTPSHLVRKVRCQTFVLWFADKGTGKKQDIKITGASTLAGDEVDRMVKDAEKFADEDKKKREAVDVKNQVRPKPLI